MTTQIETCGGYKIVDLKTAFERVQNKDHWKGPIDAFVTVRSEDEIALIEAAVEFYTATRATVRPTSDCFRVRITAPGYWAGPAN